MNESEQAQTIAEIKRFDLEQRSKKMMVWEEMAESADGDYVLYVDHKAIVDSQAQKIAEQEKELKLLRYVLEAEKTARIYEDGTGAAGEALFHARKELEEYDSKTGSK